jgi:putative endonuclease
MSRAWVVYIVESVRGTLYTGVTTELERRLREHAAGTRGARFFRLGGPAAVRYVEPVPDRSSAQRREAEIKRLTRRAKLELIATARPPRA